MFSRVKVVHAGILWSHYKRVSVSMIYHPSLYRVVYAGKDLLRYQYTIFYFRIISHG